MTTPLVSICIPTYRGAATIGATIASVLAQEFTDFELIVIDDCSPDDTRAVVEGFDDARLRYVCNARNLGPAGNWNRGFELATGSYFKLLPHDDVLAPACLAEQVRVLDADGAKRVALVFCARDVIGPDGGVLMGRGYPRAAEGAIGAAAAMRASMRAGTNLIGEPGGVMFRRELAAKVGPFDAAQPYVIDLDYWFRLLVHGDAYYLPARLAAFRVSNQQWSVVLGDSQASDFNSFIDRIGAQIGVRWTAMDLLVSRVRTRTNNWLRLVFYFVFLRVAPALKHMWRRA